MELENLRSAWEIHTNEGKTHLAISESAVDKIVEEKTKKAKRQVTKRMTLDAAFMILVVIGFSSLLYLMNLKFASWGIVFLIGVAFLLFIHYHFNSILLNRNSKGDSVLAEVNRTLKIIRRYVFIYQWIFPAFIAVAAFLSWQWGIYDLFGIDSAEIKTWLKVTYALAFATGCWGVLYLIIRWSFGKQTKKLKQLKYDLGILS